MDLTEAKRFVECEKRVGGVHPHPGMVLSLVTEINRLQAIVDKLPKTADGVLVVPTVDTLYLPFWGKVEVSVTYCDSNGFQVPANINQCYLKFYKTREAAPATGGADANPTPIARKGDDDPRRPPRKGPET